MIAGPLTLEQQIANLKRAIFGERPKIPVPCECIYFLRAGRYVKIGHALHERLYERTGELQIGNPEPLDWLASIVCWEAQPVERRIHGRFEDVRVRGEWFWFTPRLAAYIEDHATLRNPRRDLVELARRFTYDRVIER